MDYLYLFLIGEVYSFIDVIGMPLQLSVVEV